MPTFRIFVTVQYIIINNFYNVNHLALLFYNDFFNKLKKQFILNTEG